MTVDSREGWHRRLNPHSSCSLRILWRDLGRAPSSLNAALNPAAESRVTFGHDLARLPTLGSASAGDDADVRLAARTG